MSQFRFETVNLLFAKLKNTIKKFYFYEVLIETLNKYFYVIWSVPMTQKIKVTLKWSEYIFFDYRFDWSLSVIHTNTKISYMYVFVYIIYTYVCMYIYLFKIRRFRLNYKWRQRSCFKSFLFCFYFICTIFIFFFSSKLFPFCTACCCHLIYRTTLGTANMNGAHMYIVHT